MVDWHARTQRPQHLARAFAHRGYRCFYLSPHLGREFDYPVRLGQPLRTCQLADRIWELHVGLPREPVYHHRLLTQSESDTLAAALVDLLQPFGVHRLVILAQFPVWTQAAIRIQAQVPSILVYDCHDWLAGFRRVAGEIVAAEDHLVTVADLLVFSSQKLRLQMAERYRIEAKPAIVVRNAVDVAHFPLLAEGRGKVAGYVGSLDDWFDLEAVEQAAQDHPSVRFVFVGRVEDARLYRLKRLSNIEFRGEIPYEDLPRVMTEFDVALIPFLRTPLTLATDPIKLYEYFSCGLPVVSAALPEVQRFGKLVYVGSNPKEFSAQLKKALGETNTDFRRARRAVALQESWEARADQLLAAFKDQLFRK
ncbi:MAG: glycosyltransferase [Bryobacteraceae bacterium]|nr:glycosyltransferase [Bryobacteraceae bacterium]MDW8378506.1 glycosyltransferase [Bryobacterales bacterium]